MERLKVLVIGASGMLAGPVIRKLEEAGFDLRLFSRSVDSSMFINEYETLRGDLFNPADLEKAVEGCDAIHISISNLDEAKATRAILEVARKMEVSRISMVSGCTVSQENRWATFIDQKFQAEQMIINSGIPYYIFRCTWFFDSLEMMVRGGKAGILGKQPHSWHWLSAEDFGNMVARAYSDREDKGGIYYAYGPEKATMKDLLERYCREFHPEIKKVGEAPIPLLRVIAFLTRNKKLRFATDLFSYFEKVSEPEIPEKELARLGRPVMDFNKWVEFKRTG